MTLPSAYAGGELMIGKGEDWKAYRGSRDSLALVAFYADCQHEVLKVRSGYRINLTYNLMPRGDTSPRQEGDAGTVAELADLFREHFCTPATYRPQQDASGPGQLWPQLLPGGHLLSGGETGKGRQHRRQVRI